MGKPYLTELEQFDRTYQWALEVPIDKICAFLSAAHTSPLFVVGSGGSVTAAHMAALLHQDKGTMAKSVTPFDLANFNKPLRDCAVLLLSAGGRNADILSAFRLAATSESRSLMAICMRTESPLLEMSQRFQFSKCLGFDLPSGKDGFLATNSLIAFVTLLIRSYGTLQKDNPDYQLPSQLDNGHSVAKQLEVLALNPLIIEKDTWIVLYGGWGLPAATDIESKFSEAALGHILLADYRNFGHGRHHWLAKRGADTGVITLATPTERDICEKTLKLLPREIPTMQISTEKNGPVGALELLNKTMHLTHLIGESREIDPGKPGVPDFGKRLYHLRAPARNSRSLERYGMSQQESIAIMRKVSTPLENIPSEGIKKWRRDYKVFVNSLKQSSFGGIVFDYDGTLCDTPERYSGLSLDIREELTRLLEGGFLVGIATGRGKSAREALRSAIEDKYWQQVIVGYYNGSDISCLEDCTHPHIETSMHPRLMEIACSLRADTQLPLVAHLQFRPSQITVEADDSMQWSRIRAIIMHLISRDGFHDLRLLESSHSMDIIAPGVTKLKLVEVLAELAAKRDKPKECLCIGDRGQWPGNDYDLLSTSFSLSVDTVSPSVKSCWNFAPAGYRGVQATLWYLKHLKADNGSLCFEM